MLTYSEERALLEDIKEGIQIALHREGYTPNDIDPIKVNKLAYFAILEFDLDVTYGWYKYGPAPVDVAVQSSGSGPGPNLRPNPADEIRASERSRVPSEREDHPSPERYAEFFEDFEEFHKIAKQPTKEYLKEFYAEFAPDEYKQLYRTCIDLQQDLDEIAEGVDWGWEGEEVVGQLTKDLNQTYGELLQTPQVEESVEAFRQYKRFIKNVVSKASENGALAEEQHQFIEEVVNFFYGNTWRYTALLISRDTLAGDNEDRLRTQIDDDLAQLRREYSRDLSGLERNSRLFNLYPFIDEDNGEPYNPDVEYTDQLSKLGSEVIKQ